MKVDEFEKEFLSMPEKEQMDLMRKIMPVFCRSMMQNPERIQEMFSLFTEECGGPMKNMFSMMGMMMGRKGGGCCG